MAKKKLPLDLDTTPVPIQEVKVTKKKVLIKKRDRSYAAKAKRLKDLNRIPYSIDVNRDTQAFAAGIAKMEGITVPQLYEIALKAWMKEHYPANYKTLEKKLKE